MSFENLTSGNMLNGFPVDAYVNLFTNTFIGDNPNDPILGVTDDVIIADNLRELFNNKLLTVASLEEGGELVGYSIAMPIDLMDPSRMMIVIPPIFTTQQFLQKNKAMGWLCL